MGFKRGLPLPVSGGSRLVRGWIGSLGGGQQGSKTPSPMILARAVLLPFFILGNLLKVEGPLWGIDADRGAPELARGFRSS